MKPHLLLIAFLIMIATSILVAAAHLPSPYGIILVGGILIILGFFWRKGNKTTEVMKDTALVRGNKFTLKLVCSRSGRVHWNRLIHELFVVPLKYKTDVQDRFLDAQGARHFAEVKFVAFVRDPMRFLGLGNVEEVARADVLANIRVLVAQGPWATAPERIHTLTHGDMFDVDVLDVIF
ncbi:MAG: hypothetical protein ABIH41_05475 [Nanoarchaeota archaeon]